MASNLPDNYYNILFNMKDKNKHTKMEDMADNMQNVDKNATDNNRQAFENSNPDIKDAENNNAEAFENEQHKHTELDVLSEELNQQKDKYVRLMAEFENYKRRTNQEKLEQIQSAGKDVLTDMLDVLDDMERAEKQIAQDKEIDHVKEGITLVFNKFRNLMNAKGVKPIDTINAEFDTDLHEAVANVPAPNPAMKGKVIDEVQKGYTLNDKIIRYPKVVVGN